MNRKDDSTDEELVRLAISGDRTAEEHLIRRYKGFVFDRAKPYFLPGAEQEDILQEGMMGLCEAIYAFDEEKCLTFFPFAAVCITRQILSAVKTYSRQKHIPLNRSVSLYTPVGEDDGPTFMASLVDETSQNMEDAFIGQEQLSHLERKMDENLTSQERQIFNLYAEGVSYQAIARHMGKSVKSVDNTIQRARRKLRRLLCEDS